MSDNDRAIKKLKEGLNTSWDIFLYGDKTSNTKPGNIYVYGTIAGQREVIKERIKARDQEGQLEQ